jgi:hypothetical protein
MKWPLAWRNPRKVICARPWTRWAAGQPEIAAAACEHISDTIIPRAPQLLLENYALIAATHEQQNIGRLADALECGGGAAGPRQTFAWLRQCSGNPCYHADSAARPAGRTSGGSGPPPRAPARAPLPLAAAGTSAA